MPRSFAFASFLSIMVSTSLHAQGHGAPHGAGHPTLDPATRSALHACVQQAVRTGHSGNHATPTAEAAAAHHRAAHSCLVGTWKGTYASHRGSTGSIDLALAQTAVGMSARIRADRGLEFGAASQFAVTPTGLRWSQVVAGETCQVTATFGHGDGQAVGSLEGKADCAAGTVTLMLRKTAE